MSQSMQDTGEKMSYMAPLEAAGTGDEGPGDQTGVK